MKFYQSIGTLFILILSVFGVGCHGTDAISVSGKVTFNQRLRADAGPTAGMTDSDYYSDGGPNNNEIISELYHSTIDGNDLRKLKKSNCFWVEIEGFPKLSFEPILRGANIVYDGDPICRIEAMAPCGGAMNEPESRELIRCGETEYAMPPEMPFTMGWRACTDVGDSGGDPRDQAYNQCVALDGSCTTYDAATLTADYEAPHPFCMVKSALPSLLTDTSFELQALNSKLDPISVDFPELKSPPHKVLPHMKAIGGSRTLARPLTFAYRVLHGGDHPDSDRYYWQWQVPSDGARWQENFSPNLVVNTVRVFIEGATDPDTNLPLREYLTPKNIILNGDRCTGESAPDTGTAFHLIECTMDVTPAYDKIHLYGDGPIDDALKLNWEVEFRVDGDGNGVFKEPPVNAGDPVYIEFEVADATIGTSGSGLRITPPGRHLGKVRLDTSPTFERVFTVLNEGLANAIVDGIELEGRDAADFSARVHSGKPLPLLLRAGSSFEITLESQASQWGTKNAAVVVKAHGTTGQTVELRATIMANAVDAILGVVPDIMAFFREDGPQYPKQYNRRFLIENPGAINLHRQTVSIAGPDASAFTLVESVYDSATADAPPPASRWIAPGRDETFSVRYHPSNPGMHSAVITITSDAGQETIDLHGTCWGSCAYTP